LIKERGMIRSNIILFFFIMLLIPAASYGIGFELAVGGWYTSPLGEISYDPGDLDIMIDLENDFAYEEEWNLSGRVKLEVPIVPNIYLMATPLEYEETGSKDTSFTFGDVDFSAGTDLESKLTMKMYDVGLYYGLPFLELATSGIFDVELGVNARILDIEASIEQDSLEESDDFTGAYPLAYLGARVSPIDNLAFEVEARGITYSDVTLLSAIGRMKISPIGPLFIAGGYRYEMLDVEINDFVVDTQFKGPIAEAGFQF
jgi:outer membrane protein